MEKAVKKNTAFFLFVRKINLVRWIFFIKRVRMHLFLLYIVYKTDIVKVGFCTKFHKRFIDNIFETLYNTFMMNLYVLLYFFSIL